MKKNTLTKILTYSGSIPFIFFTCISCAGVTQFVEIEVNKVVVSYAAIILSSISGMHFSYAVIKDRTTTTILILSNLIALSAWICLLINFKIALILTFIGYCANLIIDLVAYKKLVIKKWFFDLRLRISMLVMFCIFLNFWHIV